jgi:glycerol-3-phosphate acyltransferase PlsX
VTEATRLEKPLVLALDAMGGDHAPESVIKGAELFRRWHDDVHFLFYGDAEAIKPIVAGCDNLKDCSEIVHAEDRVLPDDKPSLALRRRKKSSMRLAIDAVAEGRAAGIVSAGNTGALMAMSKFILKPLEGIDRPAIVTTMPTTKGRCVMLDLGANVECSAQHLFQFAVMGDAYARAVIGLERPRVALLNIGTEELKGRDEIQAAAELLKNTSLPLNFVGYIEGDQILAGDVDVIVTDGFTGNVALKSIEGTAKTCRHFVKDTLKNSLMAKIGAFLAMRAFKKLAMKIDPRSHNGAMFIGVNGIAVKSHGGADYKAFANALEAARGLANHQINARIIEEIRQSGEATELEQTSAPAQPQEA